MNVRTNPSMDNKILFFSSQIYTSISLLTSTIFILLDLYELPVTLSAQLWGTDWVHSDVPRGLVAEKLSASPAKMHHGQREGKFVICSPLLGTPPHIADSRIRRDYCIL
jgi:hypothetical protein